MKKIASIILAMTAACCMYAQQVPQAPKNVNVFLPKVLFNNVLNRNEVEALAKSSDYGQGKDPSEKKYWVVYSDRENNKVYSDPQGKVECGTLKFNEQLRIAQIKGRYALVYTDITGTWPQISQHATVKGWIPMDNLLLWSSCPADDKGVYYKALICYNIGNRDSGIDIAGYLTPAATGRSYPLQTDLKFYFIMKRINGMALLAQEYTLEGKSSQILYYWVPENAFVPWNQRSCLEPTWEKKDVEYFSKSGMSVTVCMEKGNRSTKMATIRFPEKDKDENDRYSYRMDPYQLRYPILDGTTEDYYECSSFGTARGTYVYNPDNDFERTEDQIKQEALEKLSRINLMIVIDGTTSMEPYFKAVRDAIKEGCDYFAKEHYTIKVGAAIYRDYADGNGLYEAYPLSDPNDYGLMDFLAKGGKYGIRSAPGDKTHTEALFHGINKSLDAFHNPEESNIMLVVGDCGNDINDDKVTSQDLVGKLIAKNVNIMGFQVWNQSREEWNLFNSQIGKIVLNSLQGKFDSIVKGSKVYRKLTPEGYDFNNDSGSNIFVGAHKYPASGTKMAPDKLTGLMEESIKFCAQSIQHKIDLIVSYRPGLGGSGEAEKSVAAEIDEEYIKILLGKDFEKLSNNTLLTFRGWAIKSDEANRKYFKPVLFISDKELTSLLARLAPVKEASDAIKDDRSPNREPYISAMKALIKSFVPDITDSELAQQGVGKTMKLIAGLNEASATLRSDYTIQDIQSREKVSDSKFTALVREFNKKYTDLNTIKKNKDYKYVREFNDVKYYWIPIEAMP